MHSAYLRHARGREVTYCVKVCGKCFNGRFEAFDCFQSILEKTRRKKEHRLGFIKEKRIFVGTIREDLKDELMFHIDTAE